MFSKSERYYFDQEAIKENTTNGRKTCPEPRRRNRRTVWSINTEPCPEAHFAVFPRALIRPCIVAGSRKDDIILDPFYGAGTVGIVTKELGRRCVGIELNSEYLDIAERRAAMVQAALIPEV